MKRRQLQHSSVLPRNSNSYFWTWHTFTSTHSLRIVFEEPSRMYTKFQFRRKQTFSDFQVIQNSFVKAQTQDFLFISSFSNFYKNWNALEFYSKKRRDCEFILTKNINGNIKKKSRRQCKLEKHVFKHIKYDSRLYRVLIKIYFRKSWLLTTAVYF